MGREQSLPIFIGNDFEVAQDDICTKTWILLHYISLGRHTGLPLHSHILS